MDILQQMQGFLQRVSAIESNMIKLFKAIQKIEGTEKDKRAVLLSGSYHARVNAVYHEAHNAVALTIQVSDSRVVLEQVVSMEDYALMFKRNKRDLELFLLVGNFDPLDFANVSNLKFEIKVSKGVAENMAAIIKDVHAVGFWKPGEFIEIEKTEMGV